MRKLKLYIETSGWNFYYADDAPAKKEITREFFELVEKGIYEIYISEVVIKEILRAPEAKRDQLMKLIERYSPKEFELTQEAKDLAICYIDNKVVPAKSVEDALHVAVATIEEMDVVISWNYRHLANVRRTELFYSINLQEGYTKRIQIVSPEGVMDDQEDR